ncbi:MAG TPA: polyphosphate kinase 2 family protein [Anaerolineae bacterium]|nr:polyphosphate kinase 2 family protein [Anaerolineae bacterium]
MKSDKSNVLKNHWVQPGHTVDLKDYDPNDTGPYRDKDDALDDLEKDRLKLIELQGRLYAEKKRSLLLVLQGTDTSGKDGTIRHVMSGVNPQGVHVTGFEVPSADELAHDYLWRVHHATPTRGRIGIFNRSHYEDVLVVRVHNLVPRKVWQARYQQINDFERMLAENDTTVLKCFLYIDKDEQKQRLQERLDDPQKNWKFQKGDLADRKLWNEYMQAYEDALSKCSTVIAPWIVVPANRKWYRNFVVMRAVVETLEQMDPQYPPPAPGLDKVVIED